MEEAAQTGVFGDLTQMEKSLKEDTTGEHARALVAYFEAVRKSSEEMLAKSTVEGERLLITRLIAAFSASQKIVRHVWETLHSAALPV